MTVQQSALYLMLSMFVIVAYHDHEIEDDDDYALLQTASGAFRREPTQMGQAASLGHHPEISTIRSLSKNGDLLQKINAGKPDYKANLQKGWPAPGDPDYPITQYQKDVLKMLKDLVYAPNAKSPMVMGMVNRTIQYPALIRVDYDVKHGAYDVLFKALDIYQDHPSVQMNCWRGLSDQAHTEVGSHHITNYGGPNKGIEYMVEELKRHPKAKTAATADRLTYQYEVLQCIHGLLKWDVNGTRGRAAVNDGLIPAVLHSMKVEWDVRPTQDTSCFVLNWLMVYNPSYASQIKALGGLQLVQKALDKFSVPDNSPFLFGQTYGDMYKVTVSCGWSRDHLEKA